MIFGCGNRKCKTCQPYTYGCEYCGANFETPVANGDLFVCDSCGYVIDEQSDQVNFVDLV